MQNELDVLKIMIENWQIVFLYAFKYLKDFDNKLDDIKLEQARQDERIKNVYSIMEKRATFNEH